MRLPGRSALYVLLAAAWTEAWDTKICYTTFGNTSISPVPTRVFSSFVITTYTSTKYSTSKVPYPPVTTTKTRIYTTTAFFSGSSTPTDTITQISTQTQSQTVTAQPVTLTETTTEITASIGSTITIDAPSGFVPIQTSLPGSAMKRKRDALSGSLQARDENKVVKGPAANQYPTRVRCIAISHKTITSIITSIVTSATGTTPTSTQSITNTATATSIILPSDVTTTVVSTQTDTFIITVTPTQTEAQTTTSTVTSTPTFYAACANNNMASRGPSGALEGFEDESPDNILTTYANTSYDCCVQCFQDPSCGWGATVLGTNNCYLYEHFTCTNPGQYQYLISQDSGSSGMFEYFNGNCVSPSGYAN